MTSRKLVLAGLVAALAVPVIATAVPSYSRSGSGQPPEFFLKHKQAMDQGVSHIQASEQAARAVTPNAGGTGNSTEWSLRHSQAMTKGASHLDASKVADKK
jgi:hypothetical protein